MADTPTFIVVQDKDGAVGAFETPAKAVAALAPFAGVPFVFSRWRGAGEDVWLLPFRDVEAIAFASTDRDAVVAMQKTLVTVDQVYPDDVDHWQVRMNELVGPAQKRLDAFAASVAAARESAADMRADAGHTIEKEAVAMFLETATGRPQELDESRINIFEGVEAVPLTAGETALKEPEDPPEGK